MTASVTHFDLRRRPTIFVIRFHDHSRQPSFADELHRHQDHFEIGQEAPPFMARSNTKGALIPLRLKPAPNAVVFQWPHATTEVNRAKGVLR